MVIPTGFICAGKLPDIVFPMSGVVDEIAGYPMRNHKVCAIRGNPDSIDELVRNSGDYRVRICFTDLQHRRYSGSSEASVVVLWIEIVKVE